MVLGYFFFFCFAFSFFFKKKKKYKVNMQYLANGGFGQMGR